MPRSTSNAVGGPRALSGARLRDVRVASGLSLTLVGAGIGKSADTVRGYESGKVVPPSDVLALLVHVLGCGFDDVYVDQAVSA